MNRIIVTADARGDPMAQIPVPLLWDLAKRIPPEKLHVVYQHATNRVQVKFLGCEAPAVQMILDALVADTASGYGGLATWPGLHADGRESHDAPAETHEALEAAGFHRRSEAGNAGKADRFAGSASMVSERSVMREPTTGSILTEMREVMAGLAQAQQDRLSRLVCSLKSTLAAERLCFNKLFEAAPDGYLATDFAGSIQHANAAMYELLQVQSPRLEGQSLLMFFTPASRALVLQRLRLLRTGISESQPFTNMQAQFTLCDGRFVSVSMRVIAIRSEDAALSTLRWLIRDRS